MNNLDGAGNIALLLLMLAGAAFSLSAHAEKTVEHTSSDSETFPGYIQNLEKKSFESRKFSKRFKIKGWRISEDIYVGGVKAAGDYGPGLVLDKGSYAWGFNHQGMEFQLRF